MLALIDYGMGNLKSVAKALEQVGVRPNVTNDPAVIKNSDKIVLPGVGAFSKCMENLTAAGLVDPIRDAVASGKSFLGICLGLQLLFDESEEFGPVKGLGLIPGRVRRFPEGMTSSGEKLKVPHMGWNALHINPTSRLFAGLPENPEFYFVHSYYVDPVDRNVVAASTDYGVPFCSAIESKNVFGCQFHPEKSQKNGLKVLENFLKIA